MWGEETLCQGLGGPSGFLSMSWGGQWALRTRVVPPAERRLWPWVFQFFFF